MRPLALIVVLLLPATSAAQPAATELASSAERYVLANGLEVVLEPDPSSPRVAVVVAYRAGMTSDPEGLAGLAHMAEHMAFRRSRHVAEQGFFDLPQRWDASQHNAFTSSEDTVYQMLVPPEQLARALWLEAERMAFVLPALRAEDLELERRVVANEYALRVRAAGFDRLLRESRIPQGIRNARWASSRRWRRSRRSIWARCSGSSSACTVRTTPAWCWSATSIAARSSS